MVSRDHCENNPVVFRDIKERKNTSSLLMNLLVNVHTFQRIKLIEEGGRENMSTLCQAFEG